MKRHFIFTLTALLLSVFAAYAQDTPATEKTSKDDEKEKDFSYSLGIDYGTGKTYKGRLSTPQKERYVSPYASVVSPWGVFANASAYNLLGDSASWDQTDIGAGYEHTFGKYKFSTSYTHTFFNKNSEQVNSALRENIDLYIKRPLFTVLRTKLAFDYSFGDTTDFSISWQNAYPIDWDDVFTKDDEISWIPKFYMYFGTQNYASKFSKTPIGQKTLSKQGKILKKPTPQELKTNSRFNLTGLYFSFPLSYSVGIWYFEISPNYSITTNQPAYEPKTPNTFSFSATIGIDF